MVPKYPAARARINRNGSDSSGSEISCDTGLQAEKNRVHHKYKKNIAMTDCLVIHYPA